LLANGNYVADRRVWRCPTHKQMPTGVTSMAAYNKSTSAAFGLRAISNKNWTAGGVDYRVEPYLLEPSPATFPLLADSIQMAFDVNNPQSYRLEGYAVRVHVRHGGKANVAFGDTHIERLAPDDLVELNARAGVNPGTHFMFYREVVEP
jgi:prepilin-type processing-associated H-X9-DG protein